MTILKNLAIGLCIVVALLIGAGFTLPDSAHLERSITINARPSTVFTVLNSYKLFNRWSPWAALDPNTVYATMGPDSGVGAKQSWDSENPDVGRGSQEIIESKPDYSIKQTLVFSDFGTDNTSTYQLSLAGEGTQVTWTYDSAFKGSLLFRYFGLLLDKMIGPDYERGLVRLKAFVETLPAEDFSTLQVDTIEAKPIIIAYSSASSDGNPAAIGAALDTAYAKQIGPFMKANKLSQTGAPLAIYDACEYGKPNCSFRPGVPVDREDAQTPAGSVARIGQTPSGKMLKLVHIGPYKDFPLTYARLHAYMAAHGIEAAGPWMEQYVTDPGSTPEAQLRTDIFVPVK